MGKTPHIPSQIRLLAATMAGLVAACEVDEPGFGGVVRADFAAVLEDCLPVVEGEGVDGV